MAKHTNRMTIRGSRPSRQHRSYLPWVIATLAIVGIIALAAPHRASGQHPTPRSDAATTQAQQIVPASSFVAYPRVQEIYREAARIPAVLDGIYCYCGCERNMGHYSLLDCYQSNHAAGCDVCLSEGSLAYRMHQQGSTLEQIRSAETSAYRM
ncbi:MAG: hypothetical protein B7Z74_08780, partial [Deltaproteobacteria bacterium 21-66-5]